MIFFYKNGKAVKQMSKVGEFMAKGKDYFSELVKETNQERSKFKRYVRKYLDGANFFDMDLDKKGDFLLKEKSLNMLKAAARETFSLVEMAEMLHITQRDLTDLMVQNAQISDAIDLGYASRNTIVENAMLKLATGYKVEEKTTLINKTGNRELTKISITEKEIPPNVSASKYWLENRRRFEYKSNTAELVAGSGNAFEIKVKFADSDE
jgi:hypothetical protein